MSSPLYFFREELHFLSEEKGKYIRKKFYFLSEQNQFSFGRKSSSFRKKKQMG